MRRDLIENWKSNLYGLLGIFAACFFPMLGFLWSAERWTEEGYPEVYSFERFFALFSPKSVEFLSLILYDLILFLRSLSD